MAKRSRKPASKAAAQNDILWLRHDWPWALLLLVAVIFAYQPIWHAGFIWDDDAHITANPCIVGPLGFKEIWTTSAGWYYPLSLSSFWIEHALWGLRPLPYHLVNVLLQGACAIVLWRVLFNLGIPGSWLGAALWALHPVQVESVAWVTELKNTQSGLCYLLAILFYVQELQARKMNDHGPIRWNNAAIFLFSALAMASKTSTVVLPLVLCLCAWWSEGRPRASTVLRLWPIFLLSLVASQITFWTINQNALNDHSLHARSLLERLATTGDVFWFYLGKIVWPSPLIFIYPRWQIDAGQGISYLPLIAMVIVFGILGLYRKTWARPWFFAAAYFLVALLPVLGFFDQYFWRYSFVGDHFQYLASMGPLAFVGAALTRFADLKLPPQPWLRPTLGATVLLILATLSWRQARIYENEETLWTDTLAQNPACSLASNNLGNILVRKGKIDDAIALYQSALKLGPDSADLRNSLGNAYLRESRGDDAIAQFQQALVIDPANFGACNNLGVTYAQTGHVNDAIVQYEQALQINPRYAEAYANLGSVLLQNGQVDDAINHFRKALAIKPGNLDALNNLGWALLQKGRVDDAIDQFQKGLALNPAYLKGHNNLGIAYAQSGRLTEATAQFNEALRLNPYDADAQSNLARVRTMSRSAPPSP